MAHTKPQRLITRYPYTTSLLIVASMMAALAILIILPSCTHPIEKWIAAIWFAIFAPLGILYVQEANEANEGDER